MLAVGTPDHDRALMLRGVIDAGGFHGACGSLPYSLEPTTTGGDVALCILSLGFFRGSSEESEAEAASRRIHAADAERPSGASPQTALAFSPAARAAAAMPSSSAVESAPTALSEGLRATVYTCTSAMRPRATLWRATGAAMPSDQTRVIPILPIRQPLPPPDGQGSRRMHRRRGPSTSSIPARVTVVWRKRAAPYERRPITPSALTTGQRR